MDKRKHNQGPKAGAACAEAVKGNAQAREAHARVAARLRAAARVFRVLGDARILSSDLVGDLLRAALTAHAAGADFPQALEAQNSAMDGFARRLARLEERIRSRCQKAWKAAPAEMEVAQKRYAKEWLAENTPTNATTGKPHPVAWPDGWGYSAWLAGVSGNEEDEPSTALTLRPHHRSPGRALPLRSAPERWQSPENSPSGRRFLTLSAKSFLHLGKRRISSRS
ncbi:MAG: hypothetical protein AMK72_09320 [Planctomycetes bacterium SM23_25]|nr:MAG: hypothetical protein AMK72_09320 [Planctomycetes bacterium SM23_25]